MRDPNLSVSIKKRAGEAIALAVSLMVDFIGVWPSHRLLALVLPVIGVVVLMFVDGGISNKVMLWVTAIATAACTTAYVAFPTPKVPDVLTTSPLRPGGAATPPNGCDLTHPRSKVPADEFRIILGTNAIPAGDGKCTALGVGTCKALTLDRTPRGVTVDAELYDATGKLVVSVHDNMVDAITNERIHVSNGGSLDTLTVTNERNEELLYVRYLNPSAIVVRGVFRCEGHDPVAVTDEQIGGNLHSIDSCFSGCRSDAGAAIQIR